eukprot:2446425-Alexandrium_andersonii.AAC.1
MTSPTTVFRAPARYRQAPVRPSGLPMHDEAKSPSVSCEPRHAPAARGQPSGRSLRHGVRASAPRR